MRPAARRELVGKLRDLSRIAATMAEKAEVAELPDLRRVSVGWGKNVEIDVGGTYVFQKGRDERHIVDIIRALAWGLFESRRDSSDPSDPKAMVEVQGILRDVGETILRSWQPPCPKCDGLKHICVACDGECKAQFSDNVHNRTEVLCPECSAWLAPQVPR